MMNTDGEDLEILFENPLNNRICRIPKAIKFLDNDDKEVVVEFHKLKDAFSAPVYCPGDPAPILEENKYPIELLCKDCKKTQGCPYKKDLKLTPVYGHGDTEMKTVEVKYLWIWCDHKPLCTYKEKTPSTEDPWKHRSCGMKCRTCMWFVLKELVQIQGVSMDDEGEFARKPGLGRCRRHAPTMNGYPVCFEDDWCGDHKLDENKVQP